MGNEAAQSCGRADSKKNFPSGIRQVKDVDISYKVCYTLIKGYPHKRTAVALCFAKLLCGIALTTKTVPYQEQLRDRTKDAAATLRLLRKWCYFLRRCDYISAEDEGVERFTPFI